jgi:hypothetical protein
MIISPNGTGQPGFGFASFHVGENVITSPDRNQAIFMDMKETSRREW